MSIPLGVVTLAEHFGGRDVTAKSYSLMVQEVAKHVAPFAAEHGADLRDMHLLGTSGTVTTLAGVHLNLPRYDRRRIDGIWMNNADVTATIARLLGMSTRNAPATIASASNAPIWCSPAAPSSMRSATRFRCRGCASPIAACVRACWSR